MINRALKLKGYLISGGFHLLMRYPFYFRIERLFNREVQQTTTYAIANLLEKSRIHKGISLEKTAKSIDDMTAKSKSFEIDD